jgi:hypothetical protein
MGRIMNVSTTKRIGVVALGLLIGFVGLAAWGLEQDAGGGWNAGSIEGDPGGVYTVYELDENDQGGTEEPAKIVKFTGTEQEALAYYDSRSQNRNFVVPALIIAAGAGLIVLGALVLRNKSDEIPAEVDG